MGLTKSERSQKVASYIILCFFAAFNVCFFMPMDIFFANAADIAFPIRPLMLFMGLVTLGVFAVLFLACLFTKGKACEITRSIIFGVSMAFYIQGNFLAINMGELNGSQYEPTFPKAALSLVIWLVILAAPFFILIKFPKIFDNVTSYIPAAIVLIQALTLMISAHMNILNYSYNTTVEIFERDTRWACKATDLDTYSKNKNLIIILADEYDSFCFDNAVKEAPDSVSEFDGFTYYTNTVGKFRLTHTSISYITTAELEDSYTNLTLFDMISENFNAKYYYDTVNPPASVISRYSDNIITKKVTLEDSFGYANGVYKISFFRCMPEVLKPLFQSSGNIANDIDSKLMKKIDISGEHQYRSDNLDFYNLMPRELKSTDDNVFKFIYLFGLHDPRNVTADLERTEQSDITAEEEAVAVNRVVNEYLKILKENGVYDNSEIIFMADHGHYYEKKYPLLMYKPANQTETGIKISNAPISYDDLYPTLIKLAGGEPETRTIFDIAEDEQRVRHFEDTNVDVSGNIKENPQ